MGEWSYFLGYVQNMDTILKAAILDKCHIFRMGSGHLV